MLFPARLIVLLFTPLTESAARWCPARLARVSGAVFWCWRSFQVVVRVIATRTACFAVLAESRRVLAVEDIASFAVAVKAPGGVVCVVDGEVFRHGYLFSLNSDTVTGRELA